MVRGRGEKFQWKFPVKSNSSTGRIEVSGYRESIAESIRIILMTKKGERVMRPNFGCNIYKYMFDILDVTTIRQIELEVEDCIKQWEHRIDNLSVKVNENQAKSGQLKIHISYTILENGDFISQAYDYDTKN